MKQPTAIIDEEIGTYFYRLRITIGTKPFPRAMVCSLHKENMHIHIEDIYVGELYSLQYCYLQYIGKGYGSHLMNKLIQFARENGYEKITGNLSPIDANSASDPTHRERQIHFYKKFGFKILPSEENPQTIELTF